MSPGEAPEELRFDFGDALAGAGGPAGPDHPRRGDAEDAASALRRRVDEVIAVAQAKGRGRLAAQAMLVSDATEVGAVAAPETDGAEDQGVGSADVAAQEAFAEGRSSDTALSIAAFYERLRRAIARAFPAEVWVTGEIRGLRESRGHRYLELADQAADAGGRAPMQQLEVVCWARDWPPVAAALAEAGVGLEVGRVVRVRGRASVWEGGSKLRFTLSAVDVEALLGGIAAARRRLLQALAADGLLEANSRLGTPLVPLRIGIVTSPGSEAHRDFVGQLDRSGYRFQVLVEPSLVQGAEAPFQIAAALRRLAQRMPDLAVVVRGGGARGDLAAFDSEEVARAIAMAPFPVWTGVGHTGDHSVADEVAQRAYITPTACGQAVVQLVDAYVGEVEGLLARLSSLARAHLEGAVAHLGAARGAVSRGVRHQLDRHHDLLVATSSKLGRAAVSMVEAQAASTARVASSLAAAAARGVGREEREFHRRQQVLRAYDPRRQLERGWSLTRDADGRLLRSSEDVDPGAELTTRLCDGEVRSVVAETAGGAATAGKGTAR